MISNVMSVDLEDYYCDLPFSQWDQYKERILENTKFLLKLFDNYNINATFFTVGYIAKKHPELIEEIKSKGHEIGSHSYAHIDLRKVSPEQFEDDFLKSINTIRNISKEKILGFRAPFFSINKNNFWVYKILKKHIKYDSSIFPVKTPLYGIPNAPRFCYRMSNFDPLESNDDSDFFELPPSTLDFPIIGNIPISGGFYLRFLPLSIIKFGIKKINKNGNFSIFYIHPKDLDPQMPRIKEYSWHYYWGLKNSRKKLESLLKNFKFSSARNVLKL